MMLQLRMLQALTQGTDVLMASLLLGRHTTSTKLAGRSVANAASKLCSPGPEDIARAQPAVESNGGLTFRAAIVQDMSGWLGRRSWGGPVTRTPGSRRCARRQTACARSSGTARQIMSRWACHLLSCWSSPFSMISCAVHIPVCIARLAVCTSAVVHTECCCKGVLHKAHAGDVCLPGSSGKYGLWCLQLSNDNIKLLEYLEGMNAVK